MTGIAFEYPGRKIEKISYSGFSEADLMFFKYLKKNPLKVFPKIYDYSQDQVIMEKLKTDSPKLTKYRELLKKYRISNKDLTKEVNWEKLNNELGEEHEFTKFLKECEDGIYKIFGIKNIGDLTTSNIAQRSNGDIVYMDPIGPWSFWTAPSNS